MGLRASADVASAGDSLCHHVTPQPMNVLCDPFFDLLAFFAYLIFKLPFACALAETL
jgi:hypothetical protein